MGRGGAIYLSYTALVLISAISPASAGLWDVDIDLDPAPSPEDGPPFSARATRNRALLPYQIIGVVAAYLGTVLILGTLFLTVGRRLRKRAQTMPEKSTEMMKPMNDNFERLPMSQQRGWASLRSKKSNASSLRSRSEMGSPVDFDRRVIQADKERANEQMARMYDALYEQEEQKMQHTVSSTEVQNVDIAPKLSIPRPGRLDLQRVQTTESGPYSPYSPMTPRSPYHAIYPPDYPSSTGNPGVAAAPKSPVMTQSQQRTRTTSFGSNRTSDFTTGQVQNKQTLRKSIKNLKISAPIQRLRDDDNDDGARTPLSPRFYTNPGVPPEPPSATTLEGQGYPVTPGSTVTADFVGAYGADVESSDPVRGFPQAYPQRGNSITNSNTSQPYPESPERRRGGNATNINTSLPFRERYHQNATQQKPLTSPTTSLYPPPSAGLKITEQFANAQRNHLGHLQTGAKTPYSPYIVNGFVTPVTPRIMSREERKQKQKEDKATKGMITEEDEVPDDKDLWSSGY